MYHNPICSAFEVIVGDIVLIVELHFLNASENIMMPSLTSMSTVSKNTRCGVSQHRAAHLRLGHQVMDCEKTHGFSATLPRAEQTS